MLSLEYLDYPFGNNGILFKNIRDQARQQRMACLGFGAAVSAVTMIPLVNFIVMPAAVAGATSLYVNTLSNAGASSIAKK